MKTLQLITRFILGILFVTVSMNISAQSTDDGPPDEEDPIVPTESMATCTMNQDDSGISQEEMTIIIVATEVGTMKEEDK